jgi:hypothetical protein
MPNGMVANHSIAAPSVQYCGEPMNASIGALGGGVEALERAHDLAAWKTSIRNRPPLISSTTLPAVRPRPGSVERRGQGGGHAPLDLRLGDDVGASTTAAAPAAASAPPAFTMNRRRSTVTSFTAMASSYSLESV